MDDFDLISFHAGVRLVLDDVAEWGDVVIGLGLLVYLAARVFNG